MLLSSRPGVGSVAIGRVESRVEQLVEAAIPLAHHPSPVDAIVGVEAFRRNQIDVDRQALVSASACSCDDRSGGADVLARMALAGLDRWMRS